MPAWARAGRYLNNPLPGARLTKETYDTLHSVMHDILYEALHRTLHDSVHDAMQDCVRPKAPAITSSLGIAAQRCCVLTSMVNTQTGHGQDAACTVC